MHQPTGNTRMTYEAVNKLTVHLLCLLCWASHSGSGLVDAVTCHWKLGMAAVLRKLNLGYTAIVALHTVLGSNTSRMPPAAQMQTGRPRRVDCCHISHIAGCCCWHCCWCACHCNGCSWCSQAGVIISWLLSLLAMWLSLLALLLLYPSYELAHP